AAYAASTQDLTGLAPGTYEVTVTDANGCTAVTSATVDPATALTISATATAVQCNDDDGSSDDGTVDVTINSGGAGTLSYSWTKDGAAYAASTQDLTGLAPGTYEVTVTDANGCTAVTSATVDPATKLTVSVGALNPELCSGETLTLYATLTGGTPNYSYSWSGPNGFTSTEQNPVINNITTAASGTYEVTVTDDNGCQATASVTVTVNPLPIANIAGGADVCLNSVNPVITFTGGNGTAPYTFTYTINGGSNQTVTTTSGNSVTVSQTTGTAGTYTYSLVSIQDASSTACLNSASGSATITVRETPTAFMSGATTVCQNDDSPDITFTNPMPYSVVVTYRRNDIVQPTVIIPAGSSETRPVPTSTADTIVYQLVKVGYQSSPKCENAISGTDTVFVIERANVVATPPSQAICSTDSIETIELSSSTDDSRVTFNWTRNNTVTVTGIADSGSGDISGTLTNLTADQVTVAFTIRATINGCDGPSTIATVLVNPTPVIDYITPDTQTRCSGIESISAIVPHSPTGGTTFSWTRDHVSDVTGLEGSNTGSVPNVTLTNTTSSPITVTFKFVPKFNTCEGDTVLATAVINPTPNINDTTVTICNEGSFGVTPQDSVDGVVPTGTTYTWAIKSSTGGITGAQANTNNPSSSISGALGNSTNTTQSVTYSVTPSYNGCIGGIFLLTVNVTPEPDILDVTRSICSGDTITVNPVNGASYGIVPSGTTYSWTVQSAGGITDADDGFGSTITDLLTNSTNSPDTVVYEVTPTAGICPGDPFSLTVIVKPIPDIVDLTDTICSGETFSVTPEHGTDGSVPDNTTYSWSVPNVTGGITGGTIGGGASSVSGTLSNPTSSVQYATYTVTPSSGSCPGETFEVKVTVNPRPAINPVTQTICSGDDFTFTPDSLNNGKVPDGTTYTWSAPSVSGITGTASGTDTIAFSSGTLINTTTTAKTVPYIVTPKSGDCPGNVFTVSVKVNPTPVVADTSAAACSDVAFSVTPANGTSGNIVPSNTSYSWGTPVTTGGMTGSAGIGNSITGTLVNETSTIQTVTYTVTPTSGTCPGETFTLTVSVNPVPDVTISGDKTICYGTDTPYVTFTNKVDLPVTVTYNFDGANFQYDLNANETDSILAVINNEGSFVYSLVSAEYQDTPACATGLSGTATINVEPITTVAITRNPLGAICQGEEVTFTADTANAGANPFLQWQISIDGGSTWGDLVSETNVSFSSTTLNNAEKIRMMVTTQVGETPCPGNYYSSPITMTVNDLNVPQVSIYESANPICDETSVTFMTDLVINGGANPIFQWLVNDNPVGGNSNTYTFSTLSDGDSVKVVMIPDATVTCPGPPDTSNVIVMQVDPLPTAVAGGGDSICVNQSATVSGASAANGTILWTHNGGGSLTRETSLTPTYTSTAGDAGNTVTLTMTVTSDNSCGTATDNANYNILVYPLPVPTISGDLTVCENSTGHIYTTEPGMSNYVWTVNGGTPTSGGGSADDSVTVDWGSAGTGTVSVNYTNANGCTASSPTEISVGIDPLPTASAGGSQTICVNETATASGASASNGDISWTVTTGNGSLTDETSPSPTYTPDASDAGTTVTLTMEVTSDNACGNTVTAEYTIDVDPLPTASAGGSQTICVDETATVSGASASNGTILWTHNGAGSITSGTEMTLTPTYNAAPGDAGNTVTLTMTVTSDNECAPQTATAYDTIDVNPLLQVSVSIAESADTVCASTSVTFTATPINGGTSPTYEWFVNGSSQGNDSPNYTVTPADGDEVYVRLVSNETCTTGDTAISNAVTLKVYNAAPATPNVPQHITGQSSSICPIATGLQYWIPPVPDATSYTWNFPAGWTITSGQGDTLVTVTAGVQSAGDKNITVTATNVCGSTTSAALVVAVNTFAFVDAGPDIAVCAGETQVQLNGTLDGATTKKDILWTADEGSFQPNATTEDPRYNVPASIINGGSIIITLTAQGEGECPVVKDSMTLTVRPDPTASVAVSGTDPICEGSVSAITFTATANTVVTYQVNGGTNQTISVDGSGTAILDTGPLSASTTYTLVSVAYASGEACSQSLTASTTMTVNPAATADAGEPQTICADGSATLNGSVGGGASSGTWSGGDGIFSPNSSTLNATYTPTASEIAGGSVNLTLTTDDPDGPCEPESDNVVITINPLPVVSAPSSVCVGETKTISPATGGTWASSNSSVATVDANGVITGIAAGTVTFTFTDTATGCSSTTLSVTVNPLPVVSAPSAVCVGETETLDPTSGGTWTSSNSSVATVDASGEITGISAGTVSFTFTLTSTGCSATTSAVTVNPLPAVSAPSSICVGETEILSPTTGGTWTSSNPSVATVDANGVITGIAAGTVTFTFTQASTGCSNTTPGVTVYPLPVVDAGTYDPICQGSSVNLAGSISGGITTGRWSGGSGSFNPGPTSLNATYTPTAAEVNNGSVTLTLTSDDPAGPCGPVSDITTIVINKAVVITSQPSNTPVCVGEPASLTVAASGDELTYQWYKGGVPITGATSETLSFSSVSLSDDGSYYVWVKGAAPCDSVKSNTATLNVDAAITITTQPASITKCEGTSVSFNIAANAGGAQLAYQWYKKGSPDTPVGSNSSSYTISGITPAHAGDYYVVVSGPAGFTCSSVTSNTATLTVNTNGTINPTTDVNQTVCIDSTITAISFEIGGSATDAVLSGSWPAGVGGSYSGGIFIISGTPTESGTFNYTVTTTGADCVNPSVSGTITVNDEGTIELGGGTATQTVCKNTSITSISYLIGGNATGAEVPPGSLPAGVTGSYASGVFTISGKPTEAGVFSFTVSTTGSPCYNQSLTGTITVRDDATISLTGDADQAVCIYALIDSIRYTIGGSATGVILSGNLPNGVELSQDNDSVFIISGTPTESGTFNYSLTTTGPCLNTSLSGSIQVDEMPDGGFLSPAISTACTADNSDTLKLESYVGNVIQWEMSLDGGVTWDTLEVTTDFYVYNDIPNTALFVVLVGNDNCNPVYSGYARVTVIPEFKPVITASGGDICAGEPVTLTGTIPEFTFDTELIPGGDFNQANLHTIGWNVYEDGIMDNNFPANNDNEKPTLWAETNGPKNFCGGNVFNSEDKKFAIVSGGVNSWMETPVFSLPSTMSSAELSFKHAYMLDADATARITLSTDGGNTYNILLAEYSDTLMSGDPNVINDVGVDLSDYIGTDNLRIRFEFDSPSDCSVWAVDNISLPAPPPDITYQWGPIEQIPVGGGEVVVVLPPSTTDYTLTVFIAGCPGSADYHTVYVINNPVVHTTNACAGGSQVAFTQSGAPDGGEWSVTGGGTINVDTGVFTPTDPGCFVATYTTTSGDCSGSASFVVFPAAPDPVVNTGCGPIVVTPPDLVSGFKVEYSFDNGANWGSNTPPTVENCNGYYIKTRYVLAIACDTIPVDEFSSDPVCSESDAVVRRIDTNDPTFTVPADKTIYMDANCGYNADTLITGYVEDEFDNCSEGLNATYSDEIVPGECGGEEVIQRTWILEDDCGHQTVDIQYITVVDTVGPTIICPPDSTVQCIDEVPAANISLVTATDKCSAPVMIIHVGDVSDNKTCPETITRTYRATDECGNTSECTQLIIVKDTTPPVISPQASNGQTDCSTLDPNDDPGYQNWLSTRAGAAATDNCDDDLEWTNDSLTQTWGGTPANQQINITWTVKDDCGNTAQTTATYTITDDVPPTITCPGNVEEIAAPNNCSKILATPTNPTINDDCSVPALSYTRLFPDGTFDNDSGTVTGLSFPVGVTTVTYTATDAAGLTATCSFTVKIVDVTPPNITIGCQSVIGIMDATDCYAIPPDIVEPDYNDDCWPKDSLELTFSITGAWSPDTTGVGSVVGLAFPVGISTVTYTVTDPDGNTAECSFTVTMLRDEIPSTAITCPSDPAAVTVAADACDAFVNVGVPAISEYCETATYTITNDYNIGTNASDTYPVGVTYVTYTISDNSGNDTTCVVTVQVIGTHDPEITCPTSVTGTMDASDCVALPPSIGEPVYSAVCWSTDSLELSFEILNATWDTTGVGSVSALEFPVGVNTVTYTVTDPDGNTAECSFTVTMLRDEIPSTAITCPSDPAAVTVAADACDAFVNVGVPAISEYCETATYTITNDYNSGTNASDTYPVGVTYVTYTISDNSGNDTTCVVTVQVIGTHDPEITCPTSVTGTMDASDCVALPPSIGEPVYSATCWPTDSLELSFEILNATWDTTGVGSVSALEFPVGVNTVTYTVTDPDGNTAECSFIVTMLRDEIPSTAISCPSDPVAVTVAADACDAYVNVGVPTISEYCETATYTITNDYNSGTNASDTYPVGVTYVTYTISDNSGNDTTCVVTVQVIGTHDPEITCPTSVTGTMDASDCVALPPSMSEPVYSAVCWPTDSLELSFEILNATWDTTGVGSVSALEFPVGVNTVTYTVTDPDGNSAECSFTVTMLRDEIPSTAISCPSDPAAVTVAADACDAFVNVGVPTISEYCETAIYTITNDYTGTDNADALYPIGITEVVWTISDNSGNDTTCTVTVEVLDQLPSLSCPPSITVPADLNETFASGVEVGFPNYADNCDSTLIYTVLDPSDNLDSIYNDPSGINLLTGSHSYDIGVTTITYYFEDGNGHQVNCDFTVTVTGPPLIECPPDTTVYADTNCEHVFDPGFAKLLEGVPAIEWTFTIINPDGFVGLTDTYTKNTFEDADPIGNYPFQLGESTITWSAANVSGSDTCSHLVMVLDTIPPVVSCTVRNLEGCDTEVITGPAFSDTIAVSDSVQFTDAINLGTASDNCSIAGVEYVDVVSGTCPIIVTRTWTVYDDSGNRSSCDQEIRINAPPLTPADPTPGTANACNYADQVALDAAISAWVTAQQAAVVASVVDEGCAPVVTNDYDGSQSIDLCGGDPITINWTITDLCDTITFDADFILIPPVTPDYTAAADTTAYSCSYAN
ncbi:HYR domain-containing protein, partial [Mangrovibacterium lignilyticum]|uniref:HYR domain-containing protein n=1 Tax=Mangrovibacterium lignilyticum TaxID=2668052 RepID=UPI0013D35BBE